MQSAEAIATYGHLNIPDGHHNSDLYHPLLAAQRAPDVSSMPLPCILCSKQLASSVCADPRDARERTEHTPHHATSAMCKNVDNNMYVWNVQERRQHVLVEYPSAAL